MDDYQLDQFRALLAAGGVRDITVIGQAGGWACRVTPRVGDERLLRSRRGLRTWARLDTLARFLRTEGVTRWSVVADKYTPRQRALVI